MEKIEIFQVLGIEETKDERAIKNAYREKLAVTNPEDNPEGFKRLRTAFEEACRLAKEPEGTVQAEKERDTSPSGLWVEKIAEIYRDITKRRDVGLWKEAFQEDIFFSLEEEENCRKKLLIFLMDHYHLPTDVWKLLDEKLNIIKDREQLRESFPADFVSYIANKCERGENVEFDQFEGAPDAPYDQFLHYYDQGYHALDKEDFELAQSFLKNADDLNIFHPIMELFRAEIMEKQGEVEEAIALLQALNDRFPKDVMVSYNCAELLWRNERKAEAAALYERMKEENDSHYMSNVRLSTWYYEEKRYRDAKKAAEKVLAVGGDEQFREMLKKINCEIERELEQQYQEKQDYESGLELCWCYLQDGKNWKGICLAESLKAQIPEEKDSEYKGLLTKLYIEMTEYEKSLEMSKLWEAALQERLASEESEEDKKKDRDRIKQVHLIRMNCYRALAEMVFANSPEERSRYYGLALAESEELENGTAEDIGLLLEKARIYVDMQEYEKCHDTTRKLILDYQVYAAYAIEADCYRKEWNAGGVIQAGRRCIDYFPGYVRSYEYMAKVYLDLEHKEELLELLKEAEKNGVKSPMLNAYRFQMDHEVPEVEELDKKLADFRKLYFTAVEKGDMSYYKKGLPLLTEYLYCYPGAYMLVERALFHRAAHHYEEAIEDFEKALVESPNNQYALYGLSFVYKFMGNYEEALVYIKRAVRHKDDDMSHGIYADLANIYSLLGSYDEALRAYETFQAYDNYKSKYHANKYALAMVRCGKVEEAIEMLKKAHGEYELSFYDEAVNICQLTGNVKQAGDLLHRWNQAMLTAQIRLKNEDYAAYYCRASWQELLFGKPEQAMLYFEKELEVRKHMDHKGTLCDTVFGAILCGDDKRGKLYAAKLREVLEKEEAEGKNSYFNQELCGLESRLLANYYTMSVEELEKLLDTQESCEVCHFCTYYICKELEAVRILLMLRKGQVDAALERVASNLAKQPVDEYMLAIRNRCAGGVKESRTGLLHSIFSALFKK